MSHRKIVSQIEMNIYRRRKRKRGRRRGKGKRKRKFNEEDDGFSSGHVEFERFLNTK